ncbi:hypothetical protein B0T26DRAFT_747959 [Lasiosphaeria miniovina]|uniref:Ankyrin n=1 Tax=Lasiosphaeria miniovina TaxID=1954250 RepID=A0AA40E9T9_9PEZI|nr:uncharacterized protein B0T26DRAFT_747959 [Lasiosphaeria miniovina]KAK0727653.1 hypothetical protein B0T26DRAFT_747959 [Lasiosphaeria miniovina]
MDPLSIITGIAGVVGFAAATTNGPRKLISDINDTPELVEDISLELDGLDSILELDGLDSIVDLTRDLISPHKLHPAHATAIRKVKQSSLKRTRITNTVCAFTVWPKYKSSIKMQKAVLKGKRLDLILAFNILNGAYLKEFLVDIKALFDRVARVAHESLDTAAEQSTRRGIEDCISTVADEPRLQLAGGDDQTDGGTVVGKYWGQFEYASALNKPPPIVAFQDIRDLPGRARRFSRPSQPGTLPPSLHLCALLDEGFDANSSGRGMAAVHLAAMAGDMAVLAALVAHGADINRHVSAGALEAPRGGYIKQLTALRDCSHEHSPLTLATNNMDVFRFLLEHGANPDLRLPVRGTPCLNEVCDNLRLVSLLVEYGADVNARLGDGVTLLHEAVWDNRFLE